MLYKTYHVYFKSDAEWYLACRVKIILQGQKHKDKIKYIKLNQKAYIDSSIGQQLKNITTSQIWGVTNNILGN